MWERQRCIIMFKLEEIPMFTSLSGSHLKELQRQTIIKQFTKDSIVFYEGDESSCLHILIEGKIKLYKTTPKGTQIQINRMSAPNIIGEYACFEQYPFPASCEFLTDGVMGLLPFEIVYKNLNNPDFSLEIIKSLTGKVTLLSALVHKETILSSEAKVADLIMQKVSIFQRLKNNEIASVLNLTPETFSRILTKFKKEDIITIKNHEVTILNRDALNTIIETNTMKNCKDCFAHFKNQVGVNR